MSNDTHPPVIVRGAPFQFRTLHPPDGRHNRFALEDHTLDRIVTVTLSAIAGMSHREQATREVVL